MEGKAREAARPSERAPAWLAIAAAILPACPSSGSGPDPRAPAAEDPVCGPDLNPRSPTAGVELCAPRDLPDGTALYFASVRCGHCIANVGPLRRRMLDLEAEGFRPRLIWVQLGTAAVDPDDVAERFDAAWDFPVLQDTPDGHLWRSFRAEWYQVAIVDRSAGPGDPRRFGPFSPATAAGEEGERLVRAWRAVLSRVGEAPPHR